MHKAHRKRCGLSDVEPCRTWPTWRHQAAIPNASLTAPLQPVRECPDENAIRNSTLSGSALACAHAQAIPHSIAAFGATALGRRSVVCWQGIDMRARMMGDEAGTSRSCRPLIRADSRLSIKASRRNSARPQSAACARSIPMTRPAEIPSGRS